MRIRQFECFIKNAIAFLIKCIENAASYRLLDTIFNSKAVALLLKTTPLDLFLINLGKFRKEKSV